MTELAGSGPWGLYVHIPFCPYKCAYCDFVALADGPRVRRWHEPYVADLVREAELWVQRLGAAAPVSVFYGGGTPTMLGSRLLAALHEELVRIFAVPEGAEVTVEANPGTVDPPGLRTLRSVGVNRLSIGLQAAQDRLLERLGRLHTFADFAAAFRAARDAGFDNISVDLMYGLPDQTQDDLRRTLARILETGTEHVSAYALQVEAGTPLAKWVDEGGVSLPDDADGAEAFWAIRGELGAAGFEHYEVSNFARPGHRCRHNLLYWQNADYLGLGVGAHSHWAGTRWANTSRLATYRDGLRNASPTPPTPPWVEAREAPDAARERSEGAFLGLRLLDGIDLADYAVRYGQPLAAAFPGVVERLVSDGLCEVTEGRLRLRADAVAVGNRAFAAFV